MNWLQRLFSQPEKQPPIKEKTSPPATIPISAASPASPSPADPRGAAGIHMREVPAKTNKLAEEFARG